ncbi:MAG: hypothetical protein ACREFH_00800 [Stellaceae bacterium]
MAHRNRLRLLSRDIRIVAAISLGALAVGCSAPDPSTAAGQSEIAGQKCQLCLVENPGDGSPCYQICMQRQEDQEAYTKAYHH